MKFRTLGIPALPIAIVVMAMSLLISASALAESSFVCEPDPEFNGEMMTQIRRHCPVSYNEFRGHPGSQEALLACRGTIDSIHRVRTDLCTFVRANERHAEALRAQAGEAAGNEWSGVNESMCRSVMTSFQDPGSNIRVYEDLLGTRIIDIRRALIAMRNNMNRVPSHVVPKFVRASEELGQLDQKLKHMKARIQAGLDGYLAGAATMYSNCQTYRTNMQRMVSVEDQNKSTASMAGEYVIQQAPGQVAGGVQTAAAYGIARAGAIQAGAVIASAPVSAGLTILTSSSPTNRDHADTERFIRELYRDGFEGSRGQPLLVPDGFRIRLLRGELIMQQR